MARRSLLGGYRLRRGPALVLLVLVGVVGALLILRSQLRPSLSVAGAVTVPAAAVGTDYAFDEQLCLGTEQVGATVRSVRVDRSPGLTASLRVPPLGAPPVIAFPVEAGDAVPAEGLHVGARETRCLRLLLRADAAGTYAAPEVSLQLRYGPGGLFRRTFTLRPPASLQVDRTGRDPRLG